MGKAAVLPVYEDETRSMWSHQTHLQQLSIDSNGISLLKLDLVLTTGLAPDVASRSWSVSVGRPPGVTAYSGDRLPEKLALLERVSTGRRRRAVDEGGNIITLCILAGVKDLFVQQKVLLTPKCLRLVLQVRCSRSGGPVLGGCCHAAVLDIPFGSAGSLSSDRSDAYYIDSSTDAKSGHDGRISSHGVSVASPVQRKRQKSVESTVIGPPAFPRTCGGALAQGAERIATVI